MKPVIGGTRHQMRCYSPESFDPEPLPVFVDTPIVIFGLFRSGTNYARMVLEKNYHCVLVTDNVGWKHGEYSGCALGAENDPQHTVFLFSTKAPFANVHSLYRYYCSKERNIESSKEWVSFLRDNISIFNSADASSLRYTYSNPVQYWTAMNSHYASKSQELASSGHIRYESFLDNPVSAADDIMAKHQISRRDHSLLHFHTPKNKTLNTHCGKSLTKQSTETTVPFDASFYSAYKYLNDFTAEDLQFVLNHLDFDLVNQLGYNDELSEVYKRLNEY